MWSKLKYIAILDLMIHIYMAKLVLDTHKCLYVTNIYTSLSTHVQPFKGLYLAWYIKKSIYTDTCISCAYNCHLQDKEQLPYVSWLCQIYKQQTIMSVAFPSWYITIYCSSYILEERHALYPQDTLGYNLWMNQSVGKYIIHYSLTTSAAFLSAYDTAKSS